MNFTQKDLKKFLSQVFFYKDDSSYVVPMQGNFQNPQDASDEGMPRVWLTRQQVLNPDGSLAPSTWVGFKKGSSNPRTQSAYGRDEDNTEYSKVYKIAPCQLQIVGVDSEDWAESVSHWLLRGDVQDLMDSMDAQLMADELGRIEVSTYIQDGLNTVLAYNVFFNVQFASTIDVTNQPLITSAEITGSIEVE